MNFGKNPEEPLMSLFTPTNTEVLKQLIFSFKGRKKNKKNSTTYYTSMAKELHTYSASVFVFNINYGTDDLTALVIFIGRGLEIRDVISSLIDVNFIYRIT